MDKPHTTAILAHCNGVLGINNDLAVHSKHDMQFFKETTMNHAVIMGRKTVESLPKKLEGRIVIALTRDTEYTSDKCDFVVNSVEAAYQTARAFVSKYSTKRSTVFIAGGAEIYDLFAPYLDAAYITEFAPEHLATTNLDGMQVTRVPKSITQYATTASVRYVHKQLPDCAVFYCTNYNSLTVE